MKVEISLNIISERPQYGLNNGIYSIRLSKLYRKIENTDQDEWYNSEISLKCILGYLRKSI